MPSNNQERKNSEKLVEGLDFYLESGRYVFTAHYLQKRGYCCQNGCRHCPYGLEKDTPKTSTKD